VVGIAVENKSKDWGVSGKSWMLTRSIQLEENNAESVISGSSFVNFQKIVQLRTDFKDIAESAKFNNGSSLSMGVWSPMMLLVLYARPQKQAQTS
jgi:hypothetical protein